MTTQDIEKLKAFCDEKGIEMIPTADRDVWEFRSKDIWNGVEYAESLIDAKGRYSGTDVCKGQILKVKGRYGQNVLYFDGVGDFGWQTINFKPSTKEEFDRYNESTLIKANISSFALSSPYSTIVFTTSHTIKDGQVDTKEFMNHIEESIEAFLNRKP